MKTTSIVIALTIAVILAFCTIFYFVHPVLVLTLKDILTIILLDAIIAFCLASYLSDNHMWLIVWTIIGAICPPVSIIAAVIKYNKSKAKTI